jgi:hypothetical protein
VLEAEIVARHGEFITFAVIPRADPIACNSPSACTPWRGGIEASGCTYNFHVRLKTNSSLKYMITAGHCGIKTFFHNGVRIGATSSNSLRPPPPILSQPQ